MTAKKPNTSSLKYQTVSKLYTVKEASEYLKIHPETLRGYIQEGKMQASDINEAIAPNGRTYRITQEAIDQFLRERIIDRG